MSAESHENVLLVFLSYSFSLRVAAAWVTGNITQSYDLELLCSKVTINDHRIYYTTM